MNISPSTQSVLMLRYRLSVQDSAAVLSDDQWAAFVHEFNDTGEGIDRLLSNDCASLIESLPQQGFDATQIQVLLKRGVALAIASEQWIGVGVWVLGPHDDLYPKSIVDKLGFARAPILFGYGNIGLLDGKEDAIFPLLEAEAKRAITEDRAEVILLGSTTMHQAHAHLSATLDVPVINPGPLSYKLLEAMLGLGLSHSRSAHPTSPVARDDMIVAMMTAAEAFKH